MTPTSYRQALTTLSLTNDQAAIWLGVGRSTAYRYATKGPSGPAARAVGMAVALYDMKTFNISETWGEEESKDGQWLRYEHMEAAVGLPG